MTKVTQRLGEWGEKVAADHLVAQGMVVLDRNWRTASGEIDIIARDGNVVVFCEQKLQDLRQTYPAFRRVQPQPESTIPDRSNMLLPQQPPEAGVEHRDV